MIPISPTLAHVPVEGWGDFANGALHPLLNPSHVLLIVGLALLLGQQVPLKVKAPILFFGAASAISLALTSTGIVSANWQLVITCVALCLGALVALGRNLSPYIIHTLCVLTAFIIGLDSEVETGTAFVLIKTLFGTWITLNILVTYITLASSNATGKPIPANGIRILGSWIVAIALLMLAFSLRR